VSVRHFGFVGPCVMGRNPALNIARKGLPMVGVNVDAEKRRSAHLALAAAGAAVVRLPHKPGAALAPNPSGILARSHRQDGQLGCRRGADVPRAEEVLYGVEQAYQGATEGSRT
jgi:hypothetical protein